MKEHNWVDDSASTSSCRFIPFEQVYSIRMFNKSWTLREDFIQGRIKVGSGCGRFR